MQISHKLFGFLLLLTVVCLWVAGSSAIQLLFTRRDFQKPYFVTYLSTSMFSLYLATLPYKRPSKAQFQQTVLRALQFCPLWFIANYLFNLALSLSSLSSITIISSSSGVLTLIASVLILNESPDALKFIATLFALGGVAMVAVDDHNSNSESTIGDILGFASAIAYASYSTFLKAKTEELDMAIFFGCVGALNMAIFGVGLVILNYTHFEVLEMPSGIDWTILCLNGFFGTVVSDLLWATSIRYLNPALCTVGLTITIPLSFFTQAMLFGIDLSILNAFGGVLVIIGFFLMSSFEHPKLKQYVSNEGLVTMLCKSNQVEEDPLAYASFESNTTYDTESPYSSVLQVNC